MVSIARLCFNGRYAASLKSACGGLESLRPRPVGDAPLEHEPLVDEIKLEGAKAQSHIFDLEGVSVGVVRIADITFDDPPRAQRLILLHELVHLRLMSGRLSANQQAIEKIRRRSVEPGTEHREKLANVVAIAVQEMGCDRFMYSKYKKLRREYFKMRRSYYLDKNSYLGFNGDNVSPVLHAYVTLYRLIRAEAGAEFCDNDRELSELRDKYNEELRDECGPDVALHERLVGAGRELLDISVETDNPDENDYMALFGLVR